MGGVEVINLSKNYGNWSILDATDDGESLLLTKREELEPQVEDAVDEHGVDVDKENHGVHEG